MVTCIRRSRASWQSGRQRYPLQKQPLENEEILALLQDGKKVVSKLALEWEDTLTFVFNEDCTIKRLKFADTVREKMMIF